MTTILLAIIAWVAISVMVSPLLGRVIARAADPETYPFADSLGGIPAQSAAEGGTRLVEATDYPRSGLPGASQPERPHCPRRW